jgi:hypothetical protein
MNIFLWVIQGVLAALFFAMGIVQVAFSKEKLAPRLKWVEKFAPAAIKVIGVVEMLLAVGLILPALLQVFWIIPLAALGLVVVMAGATLVHFQRKEYGLVALAGLILVFCLLVAYGRFALMFV